jgi:alpha-glucosidase
MLLLLGVLYTLAPTVWGGVSQRATLGNKFATNSTGTPYSLNDTDCPGGTAVQILWSCR